MIERTKNFKVFQPNSNNKKFKNNLKNQFSKNWKIKKYVKLNLGRQVLKVRKVWFENDSTSEHLWRFRKIRKKNWDGENNQIWCTQNKANAIYQIFKLKPEISNLKEKQNARQNRLHTTVWRLKSWVKIGFSKKHFGNSWVQLRYLPLTFRLESSDIILL